MPEHFNLPWTELAASGRLKQEGIELAWTDYPEGSGAMAAALNETQIDMAMLLTEAAVTAIARGGRFRIVSNYTRSPLIWGVHVPADSDFCSIEHLATARFAISRPGSGSHLMSFALARERGWPIENISFVEVGTLDGAVSAFADGRADVFMWERFMTKPLVESGQFRRIGEFSAPWPAFVVCATESALAGKREAMHAALRAALSNAARLRHSPEPFVEKYSLTQDDIVSWLGLTRWVAEPGVDQKKIREVTDVLEDLRLIRGVSSRGLTAAL